MLSHVWHESERAHAIARFRAPLLRPLLAVLIYLASILSTSLLVAQTAHAAVDDYRALTWNMQGAGGGKWTHVAKLVTGGTSTRPHDVVALQEAGPLTSLPSQTTPGRSWVRTLGATPYTIREYEWRVRDGRTDRVVYLYFMNTDPSGNRVNLAMITHTRATHVLTIPPQADNRGSTGPRPAFGIQLDNDTVFWNVHAGSYGRNVYNDADNLIAAASAATAANAAITTPGTPNTGQWAVLGDFNRDPDALTPPHGSHVYRTGTATQQGGGELDYMVSSQAMAGWSGHILPGAGWSDHWPVEIAFRAGGEQALILGDNDAECLDSLASVLVRPCSGSGTQDWGYDGSSLSNAGTCLSVPGLRSSAEVKMQACGSGEKQKWQFREDGTLYNPGSKRCLLPRGGPESKVVSVSQCTKGSGEQIIRLDQPKVRVEVLGMDGGMWGQVRDTPGPDGSTWTRREMKGATLTALTSIELRGTVHTFGLMPDGRIWGKSLNIETGQWSDWTEVPGNGRATSLAASGHDGVVHLQVVGADGKMYSQVRDSEGRYSPGWIKYTGNDGEVGNLTRLTSTETREAVHVFGIGDNGQIWQADLDTKSNTWSYWTNLSSDAGWSAADLTASQSGEAIHLQVVSTVGLMYSQSSDSTGIFVDDTWEDVHGLAEVTTLTSVETPDRVYVYAVDSSGRIYENVVRATGWGTWAELPGGGRAKDVAAAILW